MGDDDDGVTIGTGELLRSGRLPTQPPTRVWTGFGPGSDRCHACSALIPADEVVMEAVFSAEEGSSLFFHRQCFAAIEAEWKTDVDGASE